MKIAHLTWSMGVGGTQTMLTDIVNIQVQEGHEVGIFVIDTYVSETIMDKLDPHVKVFFMGRTRGTKPIWPFVKLNYKLWRFHPDIIHSHAGKLINIVFNSAPKIVTVHGVRTKRNEIKKYNALFAISNSVKDDLIKKGYKDVGVVANGIHCEEIKKKSNFLLSNDIHLVQVSRIYLNIKGQDIVVKALSQVINSMKDDSALKGKKCIVHFVGDGVDTKKLRDLVEKFRLQDYVVFEGFKDRIWVYKHLRDYDLFIQASRWEGFGLTVAEACAAKLPVLISDIEGPLEILEDGRLGMTFESENVEDLSRQILSFVRGNYNFDLIDKAYKNTIQKYDVSITAHRYLEEYKKYCKK